MTWRNPFRISTLNLGTQLLFLSVILFFLMVTVFVVFNTHGQRNELKERSTQQALALAYTISVSSAAGVLQQDYSGLETLLLKNEYFTEIEAVSIINHAGHVLARVYRIDEYAGPLEADYSVKQISPPLLPSDEPRIRTASDGGSLTVEQPILAGSDIGYVILTMDLHRNEQKIAMLALRNMGVAVLFVLPALGVILLFIRRPTRELKELTQFAEKLVENRGLENFKQYSSQELSLLNATMNQASRILKYTTDDLEDATRRAAKSNELKSQFVANMSHEIRTPLNGILGLSDMSLSTPNLSPATRENLELIQLSAENLLRVVNDILDFSKIEANRLEIDPQPFELRKLTQALYQSLHARYQKPNLDFKIQMDEHVPDHLVGDSGRLAQVLTNLLGNALKFTDQGLVELVVNLVNQDASTQTASLEFLIRDTGPGIAAEDQQRIFDAFSQAEPGTTRKYGGTGLGLSISEQLLKLMNSHIRLQSAPGVGSEFSFVINMQLASFNAAAEATSPSTENPNNTSSPSTPAANPVIQNATGDAAQQAVGGARILVAEDNMVNQKFIAHVLQSLGVSFQVRADGIEALKAAQSEDFDLIFMDLQMPNMGGLEASRQILIHKPMQVIVGLTADAIAGARESCLAAGMQAYLSKPFRREDIESIFKQFSISYLPLPMNNFAQDAELMKMTAQSVLDEFPKNMSLLRSSLHEPNYPEARRMIHTLKGHVRLFGDEGFGAFLQMQEDLLAGSHMPTPESLEHGFQGLDTFIHRLELLVKSD